MPEGDTVYKLATALRQELEGACVLGLVVRALDTDSLQGRVVTRVEALGKHLYIHFDGGVVLRSHLGMFGSWHRYAPGEAWKKPRSQAWIELTTPTRVLVCFNAKEVELLGARGYAYADGRRRLGPDLSREAPDPDLVVRRARELLAPEVSLVDLLLDQRVACGIGNVYKSEVLFLEGRSPRGTLGGLDDGSLGALYVQAHALLSSNLGPGPRATRLGGDGGGGLWVYGRAGEPCLRCRSEVRMERLGRNPRSTYWCAACQS